MVKDRTEYHAAYYQRNKERQMERRRAYALANKERMRQVQQAYQIKNRLVRKVSRILGISFRETREMLGEHTRHG